MTHTTITSEIPREPAYRRAWVLYQLKLRGLSFSALARRHGVKQTAFTRTMLMPSYRLECILADELGLTVEELFPERYDSRTGRRLHQVRGEKPSTADQAGNVYSGRAA